MLNYDTITWSCYQLQLFYFIHLPVVKLQWWYKCVAGLSKLVDLIIKTKYATKQFLNRWQLGAKVAHVITVQLTVFFFFPTHSLSMKVIANRQLWTQCALHIPMIRFSILFQWISQDKTSQVIVKIILVRIKSCFLKILLFFKLNGANLMFWNVMNNSWLQ